MHIVHAYFKMLLLSQVVLTAPEDLEPVVAIISMTDGSKVLPLNKTT